MIPITLRDVAMLTGGSLHPDAGTAADIVVDGPVVTDSREAGPGSLYVARVGEHADGHAYAGSAPRPRRGGSTEQPRRRRSCQGSWSRTSRPRSARVARGVVDRATDLTVVAVTGSSGKTSTKDLLAQVLGTRRTDRRTGELAQR